MKVGEVIAAICKYGSDWNNDDLILCHDIYSIEITDEGVHLCFTDANTRDYTIVVEE